MNTTNPTFTSLIRISAVLLSGQLITPAPATACTTVAAGSGESTLVAKSYDFEFGDGVVLINPREVNKQAALLTPRQGVLPARWLARFGSVTFNQFGREFPCGGMNERGLVAEVMWLSEADSGVPQPGEAAISELQWIQRILDTAATVDEAIARAREVRVDRAYGRVHYMVCDRGGRCATFEYLRGKLEVHHGKTLPVRALTNSTYATSVAALKNENTKASQGSSTQSPHASLSRFARAARFSQAIARPPTVLQMFATLDDVRIPHMNRWQVVYEPARGRVHFRAQRATRIIELSKVSFACAGNAEVKGMDLQGGVLPDGPDSRLSPFGTSENLKLIRTSFGKLGAKGLGPQAAELLAAYPSRALRCAQTAIR